MTSAEATSGQRLTARREAGSDDLVLRLIFESSTSDCRPTTARRNFAAAQGGYSFSFFQSTSLGFSSKLPRQWLSLCKSVARALSQSKQAEIGNLKLQIIADLRLEPRTPNSEPEIRDPRLEIRNQPLLLNNSRPCLRVGCKSFTHIELRDDGLPHLYLRTVRFWNGFPRRNFMVERVLDKLWRPWRGLTSS